MKKLLSAACTMAMIALAWTPAPAFAGRRVMDEAGNYCISQVDRGPERDDAAGMTTHYASFSNSCPFAVRIEIQKFANVRGQGGAEYLTLYSGTSRYLYCQQFDSGLGCAGYGSDRNEYVD